MIRGVNLIPAPLRRRRQWRRRRTAWTACAGIYAAALVLGCGAWRVGWAKSPPHLGDPLRHVGLEVEERAAELTKLRAALAEHRASMRLGDSLASRPDWSNLLALVARDCGPDVVLKRCEVSAPGELPPADVRAAPPPPPPGLVKAPDAPRAVLRLQGLGRSQAAVSRFALRLEQTGVFESIDPSSNRESFDGAEVIAFRLDCWLLTSTRPDPRRAASGDAPRADVNPAEVAP